MRDSFVTPSGEGSARVIDIHSQWFNSLGAGSPTQAGVYRDGLILTAPTFFNSAANWGFGGETPSRDFRSGAVCWKIRQGGIFFDYRIPLVVTRPVFPAWRTGLFVIECMFSFDLATTGVDCGLVIGWSDNTNNLRVVQNLAQGWSIRPETGVLTHSVRGAVGLTNTALPSVGADIREWQRVRMEFRSATANQEATAACIVNDQAAPSVVLAGNNANFPPIAAQGSGTDQCLTFGIGSASATAYCYFRDVQFWCGPDSTIGM